MNIKTGLRWAPLCLFILIALLLCRGLFLNPQLLPSARIDQRLPDFQLHTLDPMTDRVSPSLRKGNSSETLILNARSIKGQYALLNVWASWCESCAQEQAFLMQLARAGVLIYGINYKDEPDEARKWLRKWGNPYRLVGVDPEGTAAIELGVYGTPETFLINAKGKVLYRHAGVMDEQVWQTRFLPRMKSDAI